MISSQERFEGPLLSRSDRGDTFEVFGDVRARDEFLFVGFFNSVLSVHATSASGAMDGLWRNHRQGYRRPSDRKVVDFNSEKKERR